MRRIECEFFDASQHVDRALDHRAEAQRRLIVPVQIYQILPQQRHVHVLHVHQLDRARHRPRVLVSGGHDDREVAREDQHEQHHLDQIAVRLESLVVARALHHVVGAVQRAARHHVRRITKRVDLATDQIAVHAAREKHVVRADGLPSARRQLMKVRRSLHQRHDDFERLADETERVDGLGAKLGRQRGLVVENAANADDDAVLVVGADDVGEKVPLVGGERGAVVAKETEWLRLETSGDEGHDKEGEYLTIGKGMSLIMATFDRENDSYVIVACRVERINKGFIPIV
jgi:hypothetical protein